MALGLASLKKRIAKMETEAGEAHDRWMQNLSDQDLELAIARPADDCRRSCHLQHQSREPAGAFDLAVAEGGMRRLAAMTKKLEEAERRSQPQTIWVREGEPIPEGNYHVVV